MPKINETVISYAVYENSNEFLGISEMTLPDISSIVAEIEGAGIGGKYEVPVLGALEAMTVTMNFRVPTRHTFKLAKPEKHNLDIRVAQQGTNTTKGQIVTGKVKYLMTVVPKKVGLGKLATASTADASGEYAVHSIEIYIDDKRVFAADPLNYVYEVHGKDYLADVRKALGK